MFGKHFVFVNDDTNAIAAANITAKSNEKLGEKLESISQAEIKSKDRVDISLEEYLSMRRRIEELESQNSRMEKFLYRIGIPDDVIDDAEVDNIRSYYHDDIRDFVRHYHIIVDVDFSTVVRDQEV